MANEREVLLNQKKEREDRLNNLRIDREQEQKKKDLTRRAFMAGTGAAAAGLVVGGVVGYEAAPEPDLIPPPSEPHPLLYMGRDMEACTGCKICEIACSKEKEGKVWPAASRIRIYQYPPCVEFPVACYLCGADSLCIQACEVDALSMNPETSVIEIDTDKCLNTSEDMACVLCAEGCPGKTILFHPDTNLPLICDLCGGDPVCTVECPQKAIHIKGTSMSAANPDEIALALANMYALPASRQAEQDQRLLEERRGEEFEG